MKSGYQDEDEYEYESEVENNYEGHGSSPAWLARFNTVDEGIQCDMRYAAKQTECRNQDKQDYEGEGENSNYEGQGSSPTWLAQVNKVDEGIQCNMSCYEAQVEKSPRQMPSRGGDGIRQQNQGIMEKKLQTGNRAWIKMK